MLYIISAGCHLVSSVAISIFLETAWWSVSDHHHTCVLLFHLSFFLFFLSFSPLSFHKKKMFWISRFCCVSLSLKKKKSFSYALVISLNAASHWNKTVGYNDDWNLLREACGWHEREADRDKDVTSISVGTPWSKHDIGGRQPWTKLATKLIIPDWRDLIARQSASSIHRHLTSVHLDF